jgi:hypothetical protein
MIGLGELRHEKSEIIRGVIAFLRLAEGYDHRTTNIVAIERQFRN